MSKLLMLVSCLFVAQQAFAQAKPANATVTINPLKVGDKIPEDLWDEYFQMISASQSSSQLLSLGDFKDKLIIIDFWATWCAPCISSLYTLDALQTEFKDDLMVIPTTYESTDKALAFFAKREWNLPTLTNEKLLKKYFPHQTIPYQVWIKDEKVYAFPPAVYANSKIIKSVIGGESVKLIELAPLTTSEIRQERLFYSELTLRDNSKTGGSSFNKNRVSINNVPLTMLFREVFSSDIPFSGRKNRVLVEISEAIKNQIIPGRASITGDYESDKKAIEELANKTFCYNLLLPTELNPTQLREFAKDDLNRIFRMYHKIEARVENRELLCLVLTFNGDLSKLQTSGHKEEMSVERLVRNLNYVNWQLPTPIIDETSFKDDVHIPLVSDLKDLAAVTEELSTLGLELRRETRSIPVLVISDHITSLK